MLKLLYDNPTSLPVLVVKGKHKKLEGMVSSWDVLSKLAVNLLGAKSTDPRCTGELPQNTPDDSNNG